MKWERYRLILLIFTTFLFILPIYVVQAEESIIDKLVVLPNSNYDVNEANNMKKRLGTIPDHILRALLDKGVKIKLTNDIITNEPELRHLKGLTPRGWEHTGLTWDDVPGLSERIVVARIGYSQKGKGHSSFNLEIHETMHAVDRIVFNEISSTEEFKTIFNKEAKLNYQGDGYVSVYPSEYFAETASLYVYSEATRAELKNNAPLTYQFLDKLFANKMEMYE